MYGAQCINMGVYACVCFCTHDINKINAIHHHHHHIRHSFFFYFSFFSFKWALFAIALLDSCEIQFTVWQLLQLKIFSENCGKWDEKQKNHCFFDREENHTHLHTTYDLCETLITNHKTSSLSVFFFFNFTAQWWQSDRTFCTNIYILLSDDCFSAQQLKRLKERTQTQEFTYLDAPSLSLSPPLQFFFFVVAENDFKWITTEF